MASTVDENNEDEDFAWSMNLEDSDFFGPLRGKIETAVLKPVIRIPSGRLYTRVKTRKVIRKRKEPAIEQNFGRLCGAIGCDIRLNGSSAVLVAQGSEKPLFVFRTERDTIYEVAFLPPDFPVPSPAPDHFHHFYDHLLHPSLPEFSFEFLSEETSERDRAPHPALCGEVFLGVREEPL